MKLGELAIEIGVKSDIKALKETSKAMKEVEARISRQIRMEKELAEATTDEEKALIRKKYALQEDIAKTDKAINNKMKLNNVVMSSVKFFTMAKAAIVGTVIALDRMGNSLLKDNQAFMTFNRTTGIGIDRLNKTSTVAQLSGMNMSSEAAMSDIKGMQQRLFRTALEGGDTKIFQMLGFNPLGMKADDIIPRLRQMVRLKNMSAQQIAYTLEELGMSQEWVNVLVMGDKQYAKMMAKSKELNLSEKQRKKLAMLTAKQQENNMRFAKVRDELLIMILPKIQKIMEYASKFSQSLVENKSLLESLTQTLGQALKIMLLMSSINIFKGAMKSLGLLTGLMGGGGLLTALGGKAVGTGVAKTGLGKVLGGIGLRTAGSLGAKAGLRAAGLAVPGLNLIMGTWLIYDLVKAGLDIKDALQQTAENIQDGADDLGQAEEDMENMLQPVESSATSFLNRNIKAMFTNNFYNNPQPAGQVSSEMQTLINNYVGAR